MRDYLHHDGFVTLAVCDALGREVGRLVHAFEEGGTWQSATFDGAGLASGTYYYRLQVEGFSGLDFNRTIPIVLVR